MYDNTNGYRAIVTDCEFVTEELDGMGEVSFYAKSGDNPEINIYPADTQASLEPFLEGNGDYVMFAYIGQAPSFSYDYHIDEVTEGSILSVRTDHSLFFDVEFDPSADLLTGYIRRAISAASFTGKNIVNQFAGKNDVGVETFMLQMLFPDPAINGGNIDIVAYGNGERNHIARSKVETTSYGSLRKKLRIVLGDSTKLISVSFGRLDAGNMYSGGEEILETKAIQELGSDQMFRTITRMLDAPNKIYNTEVNI